MAHYSLPNAVFTCTVDATKNPASFADITLYTGTLAW